jgi:hypothetical protein
MGVVAERRWWKYEFKKRFDHMITMKNFYKFVRHAAVLEEMDKGAGCWPVLASVGSRLVGQPVIVDRRWPALIKETIVGRRWQVLANHDPIFTGLQHSNALPDN